jgi:small-conductance mechanosensitive channel
MLLKPKILLYIITVAVVIGAIVWEYYMQQWMSYQPDGGEAVMRVDLFVIWPVVLTLVAISGFRLFFDKRK